jgi:hypothetical protein
MASVVAGEIHVLAWTRGPLAEVELSIGTKRGPGASMPCVAIESFHRLRRSSAIRVEEHVDHRLVSGERGLTCRPRFGLAPLDGSHEIRPAVEPMFMREAQLHVAQRRRVRRILNCSVEARPRFRIVGL